jgi:endo-1,4-beta-xylanase
MNTSSRAALLSAVVGLAACGGGGGSGSPGLFDPPTGTPLRDLGSGRILIGTAVAVDPLRNDASYRALLAAQYDILVAENAMKFDQVEPSRGSFFWDDADFLVDFAQSNGMAIRGHNLVWHQQSGWLSSDGTSLKAGISAAELPAILENHVKTLVGRYAGKVAYWDVVNEAIADGLPAGKTVEGSLRQSFWYTYYPGATRLQYIEDAFQWAHQADPSAKLFYNEYGAEGLTGWSNKSDYTYALVQKLLDDGVPIHGVGLQMHIDATGYPLNDHFDLELKRFTDLGLEVHVTEADVRIRLPASDAELATQSDTYQGLLAACLANPGATAFLTWGLDDGHSWVPSYFSGWGAALPFDQGYGAKPAYYGLQAALQAP